MATRTWIALALAAHSAIAFAANPFVGSWKFDPARSRLKAETVRYDDLGGGRMRYSNGATLQYDFALNGKDHKTVDDRSVSWTPLGNGRWETKTKIAGKTTETAIRTLSADGDAMTVKAEGFLPDGTPYKHDKRYARVGQGRGLAGTWRSEAVNTHNMPDGYVISEDATGLITWAIPTDKQSLTGRFDGSDMKLVGPSAPTETVFAVTRVSERKIGYVMKTRGQPGQYGTMTISADGETFTEESWLPGREDDKSTGVLSRYHCPAAGKPLPAGDPAWLCAK